MGADRRAGPPRGALIALAVTLAAGAIFFARRLADPQVIAPTVEADRVPGPLRDAPAAPIATIPDLPQTPSSPVARAAIVALAASPDLRAAISSESTGTPNGRLESLRLLQRAEESVAHVHDLVVQSVTLARGAADSAPLDAAERDRVREDVAAATQRTLMLAGRLRDSRMQAIATARRMILFMEDHAGAFEFRDGAVRFTDASDQVQFSHFQVSTHRVLGQEQLVRGETAGALAEQEQLLARSGIR